MSILRPRPTPTKPGPGQESVWDYPRPARVEPTRHHLKVEIGGRTIAETRRGFRALETSHPPSYYFPPEDIDLSAVVAAEGRSSCEWKGGAVYHDVHVGGRVIQKAAWSYPDPTADFRPILGYLAFYAGLMDACWVDEERVQPQEGGFYGGWITRHVVGPFKGPPGSGGW